MSEAILIALIVSLAPTVTALIALWKTMADTRHLMAQNKNIIIPKLDHITVLTNSTLTTANKRIDDLEQQLIELQRKLDIAT